MNLRFEEETKKERRIQILKEILYFLIAAAVAVALAWLIVHFALKKVSMIGSAMETTLYNGQDVIVNKTSYILLRPKRGAVIAFYPEDDEEIEEDTLVQKDSTVCIRRIVGLPGETVQIRDGIIYIDGEAIEEAYKFEAIQSSGRANDEIVLEEDEYFVLSDKRSDLDDSRSSAFTKVRKKNIIGKAVLTLNRFAMIGGPDEDSEKKEAGGEGDGTDNSVTID